jgi:hypothetical protein
MLFMKKLKKEKAPKVKKEKKVKEKKVQSPEERAQFEAAVKGFTSSGVFKALIVMFVCSLVFTMFSSSILRLTAIPGALRTRAAAIQSNINAQNQINNQNNPIQNIVDIFVPETTSASIDVQGTTAAPTTTAPTTQSTTAATTTTTKAPETTKDSASNGSDSDETTTTTTKPTTTESETDSAETLKEKKAILNTYKKVVNTANTIKPGFTKVQYRTVEKDQNAVAEFERYIEAFLFRFYHDRRLRILLVTAYTDTIHNFQLTSFVFNVPVTSSCSNHFANSEVRQDFLHFTGHTSPGLGAQGLIILGYMPVELTHVRIPALLVEFAVTQGENRSHNLTGVIFLCFKAFLNDGHCTIGVYPQHQCYILTFFFIALGDKLISGQIVNDSLFRGYIPRTISGC